MFETDRAHRPRSGRARALLDQAQGRSRKPRAHDARELRIELAALPLRGTVAPPADALRRHMRTVYQEVLPHEHRLPSLAQPGGSERGGSPSAGDEWPSPTGGATPLGELSQLSMLSSGGLSDTGSPGNPHSGVRNWRPLASRSALPLIVTPQSSSGPGSPTRWRASPLASPLAGDAALAGRMFGKYP